MKRQEQDVFQARREAMIAQVAQDFTASTDIVTPSYDELLRQARTGLFQSEPEAQISALHALSSFQRGRLFGAGELPPGVFQNLMEMVFGNHDCFRVRELALGFMEELCYASPWCIETFLSLDLHQMAMKELMNRESKLPSDRVSYVLNAMLLHNRKAFEEIMKLGYFDSVRKMVMAEKIGVTDLAWMMTAIESIVLCTYFEEFDKIEEVVEICFRVFQLGNPNVECSAFSILARIIAGQNADHPLIDKVTEPAVMGLAMSLLDPAKNADICPIVDFFINYVCLGDGQTMALVNNGFLERVSEIFPKITVAPKAKVLEALANIVVDPPEARTRVLNSQVFKALPQILQTGELCLKKGVMILLVRVIAKLDISESLELISSMNIISSIIDLLYSDDNELVESVIRAIGLLITRGKRLDEQKSLFITEQFDDVVVEQLYELTHSECDVISQNATNLIKCLPPV